MNANLLRAKMVEKGYTQKALADDLGITVQSLNAKLNNRSKFSLNEAEEIAKILDVKNPIEIFFTHIVP